MRRLWMLSLVLVAGCSDPAGSDPASSRLAPGQAAIIASGERSEVLVDAPELPSRGEVVRVGTRVTVEADDAGGPPSRAVRITVMDGEHSGLVGEVRRDRLRPAG